MGTSRAPEPSSPAVSARMAAQSTSGTSPEIAVRRRLHSRGLRYRVNYRPEPSLRRSADIVFTRAKVAVFIDGCFWHSCPEHGTAPTANREWWASKLAANAVRDKDTDALLIAAGWTVIRCWEHEDPEVIAGAIERAVHDNGRVPDSGSLRRPQSTMTQPR